MTPELAERGAKIKHDLFLHDEMKKIRHSEFLLLQGQLGEMGIR